MGPSAGYLLERRRVSWLQTMQYIWAWRVVTTYFSEELIFLMDRIENGLNLYPLRISLGKKQIDRFDRTYFRLKQASEQNMTLDFSWKLTSFLSREIVYKIIYLMNISLLITGLSVCCSHEHFSYYNSTYWNRIIYLLFPWTLLTCDVSLSGIQSVICLIKYFLYARQAGVRRD